MTEAPQPNPDYLDEYARWVRTKGGAENTIKAYTSALRYIPEDVEGFFENRNMKGAKMKSVAYRSYLHFLAMKKKELEMNDLMVFLNQFKPPKKRGNGINEDLWSIPKDKWVDYIRHAPNQVAKIGIYLGFHFGLRLGEIMHLQIQDVDFRTKNIHVKIQRKTNNQEAWNPKYNKERSVPFTKEQGKTLKKWINLIRPKNLPHNYLLWTLRGKRKDLRVDEKCFWRWCRITGEDLDSRKFKPHVLRYSFATHYYEESKDIKLISDLLGHADVKTTSDYLRLGQKETEDKARDLFNRA